MAVPELPAGTSFGVQRPAMRSSRPWTCAFHRTAFQCAHNVALLLSFHDDPAPRFDLFGWRRGIVCARGYYISEDPHADSQ